MKSKANADNNVNYVEARPGFIEWVFFHHSVIEDDAQSDE